MEYMNLLKKLAWSFHKSTGLDWDDLFQEAYIAYKYAMDHYDPNAGANLTTFLCVHINNQLRTYYQRELKYAYPLTNAYRKDVKAHNNLMAWVTPEEVSYQTSFKEKLTKDSQELADVALMYSKQLIKISGKKQIEKQLIRIMRKKGWQRDRIVSSISNLKYACSSL